MGLVWVLILGANNFLGVVKHIKGSAVFRKLCHQCMTERLRSISNLSYFTKSNLSYYPKIQP